MFSHVTVGTSDLARAARFYDAVLNPIGLKQRPRVPDGGPEYACWASSEYGLPRFYVYLPFNREPASAGNGTMVAFRAPRLESVVDAYNRGLAAGGTDEGSPRKLDHYGQGYFGAYLRDPDGNKIHVAYRGDVL